MGYNPFLVCEEQFIASSVIGELRSNRMPFTRVQLALETEKIKVHTPSKSSLEKIEEASRRVGDLNVLSNTDKDVLAVALDLSRNGFSTRLVSDDYAIQNVAEFLKLEYVSLTTFGIRYRFRWILYCPACKRKYSLESKEAICSICGTSLKRKVLRKEAVRERGKQGDFEAP